MAGALKFLYSSFDDLTQSKGASIHIQAFCRSIVAGTEHHLDLVTVSPTPEPMPPYRLYPQVTHIQLPALGKNLIDRVLSFRENLRLWLGQNTYDVIHFRSIWEGLPLVRAGACRLIYEVNGLPSIELKYRYPDLLDDRDLLAKIRSQENFCLQRANLILTPSPVTEAYLRSRGVTTPIQVIPNGVDTELFVPHPPPPTPPTQILYFGTFAPWQGLELAIRALAQLPPTFYLKAIGQGTKTQRRNLQKLIHKLDLEHRCQLLPPMPQTQLVPYLHQSHLVVAPLTLCDRNLVQGCCPLKVLEAMAGGVPVVTTDLPVVRHLGIDRQHFLLTRPNSVEDMVAKIQELDRDPHLRHQLSIHARQHILDNFTWQKAGTALQQAYAQW